MERTGLCPVPRLRNFFEKSSLRILKKLQNYTIIELFAPNGVYCVRENVTTIKKEPT